MSYGTLSGTTDRCSIGDDSASSQARIETCTLKFAARTAPDALPDCPRYC